MKSFWKYVLALMPLLVFLIAYLRTKTGKKQIGTRNPKAFKEMLFYVLSVEGYSPRIARYWYAVSAYETGGFTSRLFLEDFNPWGMKKPNVRKTTAISETSKGFAIYSNYYEAIYDLVYYMRDWKYPTTTTGSFKDWLEFMKSKGYFEEPIEYYASGAVVWYNKQNT